MCTQADFDAIRKYELAILTRKARIAREDPMAIRGAYGYTKQDTELLSTVSERDIFRLAGISNKAPLFNVRNTQALLEIASSQEDDEVLALMFDSMPGAGV